MILGTLGIPIKQNDLFILEIFYPFLFREPYYKSTMNIKEENLVYCVFEI